MKKNTKLLIILSSIFIIVMLEQILKNIMIGKEFLIFKYVENYGIAFSLWQNNLILLITSLVIIIIFAIIMYVNRKSSTYIVSGTFIISGSISNLIDRIFRGYVIDYINIDIFNFPVFNISDILIVIGIFTIVVNLIKKY